MRIRLTDRRERGYAVVIMLGLLTLLLVVVAANTQIMRHLGQELNHLNDVQTQHWKNVSATNLAANPKP